MIVAFDVDGVLADFDGLASERLGLDLRAERTDFDTAVDYGNEVHREISKLLRDPAFWVSLKPLPGVRQQIKRLREVGAELRFYSSLPDHFEALRRWWLWNNLKVARSPDKVYLRTPRHAIKGEFIVNEGGIDWYIDDRQDTVDTVVAGGIRGFVHPAPWNHSVPDRLVVGNVEEFVNTILGENK